MQDLLTKDSQNQWCFSLKEIQWAISYVECGTINHHGVEKQWFIKGALVLELERITKTTSCQREAKTT